MLVDPIKNLENIYIFFKISTVLRPYFQSSTQLRFYFPQLQHMVATPNVLPHQSVTPVSMQSYPIADDYISPELIFPYTTEYSAITRPYSASSVGTNTSSSNESCNSNNAFDNQHMLHASFPTVMQPQAQPPHSLPPPQPQQQPHQSQPDHQHHPFAPTYQASPYVSQDPVEQHITGYTSVIVDAQQCVHDYCNTVQHKLHQYDFQGVERKL